MPEFDWRALLQAAPPLIVALAKRGPTGAAFAEQYLRSMEQMRRARLQESEVGQEQAYRQGAEQRAEAGLQLQRDAAGRAERSQSFEESQARLRRLDTLREQLLGEAQRQVQFAPTPEVAEQAVTQYGSRLEAAEGLRPGDVTSFTPSLTPAISAKNRTLARQLYERFEKVYQGQDLAEIEQRVGPEHAAFPGKTMRDLRLLGEIGPVRPAPTAPTATGSVEQQVAEALTSGDQARVDRLVQAAELLSGARRSDVPPIRIIMGPEGPVQFDPRTNISKPIPSPTGAPLPRPPTAEETNQAVRMRGIYSVVDDMEELSKQIHRFEGPAAGIAGVVRRGAATINVDTVAREYVHVVEAFLAQLSRLAGEVGNLREEDVQRARLMVPLMTDGQRLARNKFARLRRFLRERMGEGPGAARPAAEPNERTLDRLRQLRQQLGGTGGR